jgi:hypothetical protein
VDVRLQFQKMLAQGILQKVPASAVNASDTEQAYNRMFTKTAPAEPLPGQMVKTVERMDLIIDCSDGFNKQIATDKEI